MLKRDFVRSTFIQCLGCVTYHEKHLYSMFDLLKPCFLSFKIGSSDAKHHNNKQQLLSVCPSQVLLTHATLALHKHGILFLELGWSQSWKSALLCLGQRLNEPSADEKNVDRSTVIGEGGYKCRPVDCKQHWVYTVKSSLKICPL